MNQLIQLSKDKYENGEFKNHDNLMQELELWKKEKM